MSLNVRQFGTIGATALTIKVTFNGVMSPLNFVKNVPMVQKFIVGTDRQTDRMAISLALHVSFREESRLQMSVLL
jgi:hypothetical protein